MGATGAWGGPPGTRPHACLPSRGALLPETLLALRPPPREIRTGLGKRAAGTAGRGWAGNRLSPCKVLLGPRGNSPLLPGASACPRHRSVAAGRPGQGCGLHRGVREKPLKPRPRGPGSWPCSRWIGCPRRGPPPSQGEGDLPQARVPRASQARRCPWPLAEPAPPTPAVVAHLASVWESSGSRVPNKHSCHTHLAASPGRGRRKELPSQETNKNAGSDRPR